VSYERAFVCVSMGPWRVNSLKSFLLILMDERLACIED